MSGPNSAWVRFIDEPDGTLTMRVEYMDRIVDFKDVRFTDYKCDVEVTIDFTAEPMSYTAVPLLPV